MTEEGGSMNDSGSNSNRSDVIIDYYKILEEFKDTPDRGQDDPPRFDEMFYELGNVFRNSDQAQVEEDLTFLLKWGLNYGSKLSSFKASQAENAFMRTLIGPYKLIEISGLNFVCLTIPKLMIAFAGSTMKLAKDMPDCVSGVGEDKRLETPAYARVIHLLFPFDRELSLRHEEAHLYARYMFSEEVNRQVQSWNSMSISNKIRKVKSLYRIAKLTHCSCEQNQLLSEAAGRENLIPSRIIHEASIKWQKLLSSSETA